jgi:prenyl protein peptidase
MSYLSTAFLKSSSVRWAAGGWAFFIVENVVLSENRTFLIENLGDDGYHNVYGLISTAAVGSIIYAYVNKARNVPPLLWTAAAAPFPSRVASWMLLSVGLGMASQTLPKFQMPLAYVPATTEPNHDKDVHAISPEASNKKSSFQVRCPFDFADAKKHKINNNGTPTADLYGLERISRHPGLWSMALVGLGHACLVPSLPQRIWLFMPSLVAWVGGSHTDSRYRRGMGGTLDAEYDAKTSNVPFAAMMTHSLMGDAGYEEWQELFRESKPLNALLAAGVAAVWAFRRGAGPVPAVVKQTITSLTK